MAGVNYTFSFERRRAIYRPIVDRPALGIKKGDEVHCRVFGCYQVCDGEDINPYFIVELPNGRCTHVSPEQLQFVPEYDGCDTWLMGHEEVTDNETNSSN